MTAGVIGAMVAGICTWSFLEYVLHRFLGHDRRTMPNFFSREHTRHHSEGNYFAPSWKKALGAVAFSGILVGLTSMLAPWEIAVAYTIGFVCMYVSYEVVHRRAHTHQGLGAYGRFLRRHHFHHHFENTKSNHGVTTPLWDFAFSTFEPATQIHVPQKLAMQWLLDPATGGVRAEFADRYQLTGKKPAPTPASE